MPYALVCAIIGDKETFEFDIQETETVGGLRNRIKAEKAQTLASVGARNLTLYKVDIAAAEAYSEVMHAISQSATCAQVLRAIPQLQNTVEDTVKELTNPFHKLSTIFSSTPAKNTIHILVQLPPGLGQMQLISNSAHIDPVLIFRARERGVFYEDMLDENEITRNTIVPEFITTIKQKLQAKRSINTEQKVVLERTSFKVHLNEYFEVDGDDVSCTFDEIIQHTSLFWHGSMSLPVGTATDSEGLMIREFGYVGLYLAGSYSTAPSASWRNEGNWDVSLVGQVGDKKYSYRPRSNGLLTLGGYPFMVVEKCSDRNKEHDRPRMLLQAGLLTRIMNSLKPKDSGPFVAVAIYLSANGVAERYFLYQPDSTSQRIEYVRDDFEIKNVIDKFRFFFELHNLPSALPFDPNLSRDSASSRRDKLKEQVRRADLQRYTATATRSGTKRKCTESQSNISRGKKSQPFGDQATVRRLADAGYQVLQVEDPGWTPLNLPNLNRAKRPTGGMVMLKLVKSHEFAIHSLLNSIKSRFNHTVSILDEVAVGVEKIIVMPEEKVLPDVADSVFKTGGDDLARQFLHGVQFMHEQRVAHLDLKPENILVTATSSPRLLIIDFDVSVRVPEEDSWIEGYRGTEGWTAPELDGSNPRYQPIRADLWSAGRILRYFAGRQRASTNCRFKPLADALLRCNPLERPLLSETHLRRHLGNQEAVSQSLKRKHDVDAWETEATKRKCVNNVLSRGARGILHQ